MPSPTVSLAYFTVSFTGRLLQVADYNVPEAEQGIVFIDEIDKIARKGDNPSIT